MSLKASQLLPSLLTISPSERVSVLNMLEEDGRLMLSAAKSLYLFVRTVNTGVTDGESLHL